MKDRPLAAAAIVVGILLTAHASSALVSAYAQEEKETRGFQFELLRIGSMNHDWQITDEGGKVILKSNVQKFIQTPSDLVNAYADSINFQDKKAGGGKASADKTKATDGVLRITAQKGFRFWIDYGDGRGFLEVKGKGISGPKGGSCPEGDCAEYTVFEIGPVGGTVELLARGSEWPASTGGSSGPSAPYAAIAGGAAAAVLAVAAGGWYARRRWLR